MFGFGIGELVVILVIVLVIFGAGKLPEIGSGLGRSIRGFRREIKKPDEIDITPRDGDDVDSSAAESPDADQPKGES